MLSIIQFGWCSSERTLFSCYSFMSCCCSSKSNLELLYHTDVFDTLCQTHIFYSNFLSVCLNPRKSRNHFSTFHRIAYLSKPQVEGTTRMCQGHKSYLDQCSLYLSTRLKKCSLYTVKMGSALMFYLLLHCMKQRHCAEWWNTLQCVIITTIWKCYIGWWECCYWYSQPNLLIMSY